MSASKLTAGEKNIQGFTAWTATMTDADYRQMIFRGSLNWSDIAKGFHDVAPDDVAQTCTALYSQDPVHSQIVAATRAMTDNIN